LARDYGLVIAGDGKLRYFLENKARELGLGKAVKFLGSLGYRDLPSLYALATALVLPSRKEPWGVVVNESMACGTPVIVSRICGCVSDLVIERRTGSTFKPGDSQALSRAMLNMARSRKSRQAWSSICQRQVSCWGPERFASGVLALVNDTTPYKRSRLSLFDEILLWFLSNDMKGLRARMGWIWQDDSSS